MFNKLKKYFHKPEIAFNKPFINMGVSSNSAIVKTFHYSKGKVELSFRLRTDIKSELKDFRRLLKVALQEVSKEIE